MHLQQRDPRTPPTNAEAERKMLEPAFTTNPYPLYAHARETTPIYWSPVFRRWVALRYEDVRAILGDHTRFSSRVGDHLFQPQYRPVMSYFTQQLLAMMMFMDRPQHKEIRGLVNPAFTTEMLERLEPMVEELAVQLVDQLADGGEVDLIAELAYQLPAMVVAEMLGIPGEDRTALRQLSQDVATATAVIDSPPALVNGMLSLRRLQAYFREQIRRKRAAPRDDLLTVLIAHHDMGGEVDSQRLVAQCILLLITGHETTQNLIGNGVLLLLQHPESLAALRAEPALIGSTIDEILRYESPAQGLMRVAAEDVELRGQIVRAGEPVMVVIGSANRDPRVFDDPDRFDIRRTPNPYLSFGWGIHVCIAARLAKIEGRAAIGQLVQRFPDLRLVSRTQQWRQTFNFRGLQELLVRL